MKPPFLKLTLVFCLLYIPNLNYAQDFQGIAIYKSARKSLADHISDDTENKKQLTEMANAISKAFQKEFELIFNRNESIFKVIESLDKPSPANGGFTVKASTAYELIYRNIKEDRYVVDRELLGKKFLIKDSLQNQPWKILDTTRTIGNYTCHKAVRTKTYQKRVVNDDGSFKFVDEDSDLVVWYTPQIPVSHGPANFYGLPGLVLAVEDGRSTFLCTKVILNPKETLEIIEPKKGKVVSQAEFDKISDAKFKEMKNNRFPIKN